MISIFNQRGNCVARFDTEQDTAIGFDRYYGFVTEKSALQRAKIRERSHLSKKPAQWEFRLQMHTSAQVAVKLDAIEGCKVRHAEVGTWLVDTDRGTFQIKNAIDSIAALSEEKEDPPTHWTKAVVAAVILLFLAPLGLQLWTTVEKPPVAEQVVTIQLPEKVIVKAPVRPIVPKEENRLASEKNVAGKKGGTLVDARLGLASLVGRKEIRDAVGGAPSHLAEATAGAGKGGKGGSGGELLLGLGQGLKRATVGNTGVAGLGGIGKGIGEGGGLGGYGRGVLGSGGTGNQLTGEGSGRVLSKVALAEDLELEGGLDKNVIQATIQKYLGQIRRCYEQGLQDAPGIQGQVTVDFQIIGSGRVSKSQVARTTLGNQKVETCISHVILAWEFPKPVGGVDVKVSYPFVLRTPTHS